MTAFKPNLATVALVAALAAPLSAHAALVLELEDSFGNLVTVQDGGAGDLNALGGGVTFVGSVGGWLLNVSTAVGNTMTSFFGVDLNTVNTSKAGAGTLTVRMTETDLNFGMPAGTVLPINGAIGGTTTGTIIFGLFADDGNAQFGKTETLWTGSASTNPFAASGGSYMTTTDPFSLTLEVTIDHRNAPGITSFDFEGRVPEPGTLALLGAALVGLGAFRRKASV